MNAITTFVPRTIGNSKLLRKLIKWALIVGLIWFAVYEFHANYQFVNHAGIHGIVSRRTMQQIQVNSDKARMFDSYPTINPN
jgi:hypothetical protein